MRHGVGAGRGGKETSGEGTHLAGVGYSVRNISSKTKGLGSFLGLTFPF